MKNKKINVLIAPNSMKGSLNAFDFAMVVEEAFMKVSKRFIIKKLPVADGGDYTGEVLRKNLQAHLVKLEVTDPLGRQISSGYGVAGETAIIEMADASGIRLLTKGELNPLKASSLGTGTLINDAIRNGCKEILLGVGGSATIDGGAGMLTALGFRLFDENGSLLEGNGENLSRINRVQKPTFPKNISMKIICDVENPLLGTKGAVNVFGSQKGATTQMKTLLEDGLANWCQILENDSGKRLGSLNGAGAAGGVALPLVAYFDAEIVPGARYILSLLKFEEQVQWADIVITGEGKIDGQTLFDKAPGVVADYAKRAGKPVIAIGGGVESDASSAFDAIFSFVNRPMTLNSSMKNVRKLLSDFSFELARMIHVLYVK